MNGELFRWLQLKWRGLFSRRSQETALKQEMQFHLDMLVAENIAAGMTPEEAKFAAQREFGASTQYREECRDTWRPAIVGGLLGDFTYAGRSLRRSPGFTAVAVFTLALGIGVNVVVFSFVRDAMLLPHARDQRLNLVALYNSRVGADRSFRPFSHAEFTSLQGADEVFAEVAAMSLQTAAIGSEGNLQRRFVAFASANYLSALGAQPAQGRFFDAAESRPGAAIPVLFASHSLWERLGRPENFLGSSVQVDNRQYTVIGIAPPNFVGLHVSIGPDAWLPLGEMAPLAKVDTQRPGETRFILFARLRPELTPASATARLAAVNQRLNALPPADQAGPRQLILGAPPRHEIAYVRPEGEPPMALFGGLAVGLSLLVLLVACLNLANLLLARGAARHKEIAIRLALGASRWRVVRGLLAEGALLALLGGALSLALGQWCSVLLTHWAGESFAAGKFVMKVSSFVDARLIAATLGFSLLASVGFSLWPALRMTRPELYPDLKQVSGGPAPRTRKRFLPAGELPLIAQIALSLCLLFCATLFVTSARNAQSLDLGFAPGNQVVAHLEYKLARLDAGFIPLRQQGLLQSAAALPGVASAALSSSVPYTFDQSYRPIRAADGSVATSSDLQPARIWAAHTSVTRGYFATMGVTWLRGRDFTTEESGGTGGRLVAIIDETLARALFREKDPLGRTLVDSDQAGTPALEVIGIIASPRDDAFGRVPKRIYRPLGQAPQSDIYLHVQVREPRAFVGPLRTALHAIAPEAPLLQVKPLSDFVEKNINVLLVRLAGIMFGVFGLIALVLATVGVYGVKAHATARRTREIGIRVALGARSRDIMFLMLKQGAIQTLLGLTVGLALALTAGRGLSAMLYKVGPFEPGALAGCAILLGTAVLLACWIPARRATKVDPLVAIRTE